MSKSRHTAIRSAPNHADRKQKITEATLHQIALGGVDSVTFRKVAEIAAVPLGSTTYYFEARNDLIEQAFIQHLRNTSTRAASLNPAQGHRADGDMIDYLVELVRLEVKDEALIVVDQELFLYAARSEAVSTALKEWQGIVVSQIARALEASGVQQPFETATTLLHLIRGFELDHITRQDPSLEQLKLRLRNTIE